VTSHRLAILLGLMLIVATPQPAIAFSRSNWVPRHGTSYVRADSTSRYTKQWFIWDYSYQLSDLQGDNVSLEVETHFDCRDDRCYFGGNYVGSRGPVRGTHWDTNMPHGYPDVLIDDDPSRPHPTIGSGDTRGMVAGKWYYTWQRFHDGNSTTDTGAIAFQRGHRDPSWVYGDGWTVFADDTVFVVSRYSLPIPSQYNWNWP
jgi:hypothetical protein